MIYSHEQLSRLVTPIAKKYHIPAVYLFGSYARGTAREDSDIDLLIDTSGTEIKSLLQLSAIMLELEAVTGKSIDLITANSLTQKSDRPSALRFRETVIRERRPLYAVS